MSDQAKDLIARLLVKDVSRRYTAADAFNHPWIQNVQNIVDTSIASDAFDNMKNFMEAVDFKKATLIYLAAKLPEQCIIELRQLFIMIDINGDGRITSDEFQKAISEYKIDYTKQQMQDLIYMLDTNNNGYIDYTEFLAGCMKSKIYLKEDYLKMTFAYFDKDKSGFITREELHKVLKSEDGLNIPDREIDKLIKEVDFNHDDKIDYNEFLTMMRRDLKGEEAEKAIRQATLSAPGIKEALKK